MRTFKSQLDTLKSSALIILNNKVEGSIILPDGNRAFDLDDSWLIVGKQEFNLHKCPCIRDKRDSDDTDSSPLWDMDVETICEYADKFVYNK